MKTKILFRILTTAALFAVVFSNALSQGLTTTGTATVVKTGANFPADADYIDMVTVGSKLPYSVTPDPTIAALVLSDPIFKSSVFNWAVTGATNALEIPAAHTSLTPDGNADGTPTYAGFYVESNVAVQWGNTVGAYTISVSEQSQNTAGIPACTGLTQNIDAWVMAKPIVTFDEASTPLVGGTLDIRGTAGDGILGGCGLTNPINPVDVLLAVGLTGTDQYQVSYKIDYYPLSGAPVLGANAFTPTKFNEGVHSFLTVASPAAPNTGIVNTNNEIKVTIPAATYGKWVVTLAGVNDRVSRKSLGAIGPDLGTVGATASLTIWSLPTPSTGPIKHVTNLGW